ncbi:MAG TPA: hypothetical protein VMN39_00225 [Longimicrobiaceae bacterium]|nr:hypothetical protein [Longimicrobiaceae bacterium]
MGRIHLPVEIVDPPHPRRAGSVSVEEAMAHRPSVRSFAPPRLTRLELSQLLWAAQGITSGWGAPPDHVPLYLVAVGRPREG